MALRVNESGVSSADPLSGVSYFWQEAEEPQSPEWIRRIELLELAMLDIH